MESISVYSPTSDPYDSYGRLSRELSSGLTNLGYYVNDISPDIVQKRPIIPTLGGFVLGYPTMYEHFGPMSRMGPRVAVTMFESDEIPEDWVGPLNECEAVIVPSDWLVDVFKKCGVTSQIFKIPLGINGVYSYNWVGTGRPFTFLAIADRGRRKGWHIAGSAFVTAFGDNCDVRLIYKCRTGAAPFPQGMSNPNIVVIEEDLTDEKMAELYAECDCMIFPTCGEGFGFPPREFASVGGIALATEWGGTKDDLEAWGLPIEYDTEPAWKGLAKFDGLGRWAIPDTMKLAHQLVAVANMPYDLRKQLGVGFSASIKELYNWDAFVIKCMAVWNQVSEKYNANRTASHTIP